MKNRLKVLLLATHLLTLAAGFAVGIYVLPILTAADNASAADVLAVKQAQQYSATFVRDQKGSDPLHWADGTLYVSDQHIAFDGKMAPGPDYKIYLTKTQADDNASFAAIKDEAVLIGDLKNFGAFTRKLPLGVDASEYTTVQIWCERFSQFIGSARYR